MCKMLTKQTHKYMRECVKRTFCEHWSNHILTDTNWGNIAFMNKVKKVLTTCIQKVFLSKHLDSIKDTRLHT